MSAYKAVICNLDFTLIKKPNGCYNAYAIGLTGTNELYFEDIHSKHETWNDLTEGVVAAIKKIERDNKAIENKSMNEKLNKVGIDSTLSGKSYYPVRIYTDLIKKLKASDINITHFINEAILEKLERDINT